MNTYHILKLPPSFIDLAWRQKVIKLIEEQEGVIPNGFCAVIISSDMKTAMYTFCSTDRLAEASRFEMRKQLNESVLYTHVFQTNLQKKEEIIKAIVE